MDVRIGRPAATKIAAVSLLLVTTACFQPEAAARPVHTDFDGDGHHDFTVGAPGEDVGATANAGAVNIRYAYDTLPAKIIYQGSPYRGAAETGDAFGSRLTAGDYNNDGYDDLVVGIPGEDNVTVVDVGSVQVIYGSVDGLLGPGKIWAQSNRGILEDSQVGDRFGSELATGDFNRDGYDDLVVGIPYEDVDGSAQGFNAGAVQVIYGSAAGLKAAGNQLLWQPNVQGTAAGGVEPNDNFGATMAVGDFNGDGFDDLAVGNPNEDVNTVVDAGTVVVFQGSSSGLRVVANQVWHQDSAGIADAAEASDRFGYSLSAGDVNHDGRDDLIISVPYEDIDGRPDIGAMHLLYGSSSGLTSTGSGFIHPLLWGMEQGPYNEVEDKARFGYSVAVGDFSGDGVDDVALGMPDQEVIWWSNPWTPYTYPSCGSVHFLFGSYSGLHIDGNFRKYWTINPSGEPSIGGLGKVLSSRPGIASDDLLLGLPNHSPNYTQNVGAFGVATGIEASEPWESRILHNFYFFRQGDGQTPGAAEAGDRLGAALPW